VLLLDEPTTGLDPQARHLIWERLQGLLAQGKTILLTTHFMEEAERLCSRIAIMDEGRIISEGTPQALIAEHIPVSPSPLRPANLEDVFLKLTGHELRD
jgi:lipooligosaccharide transport system ATP-binding protein